MAGQIEFSGVLGLPALLAYYATEGPKLKAKSALEKQLALWEGMGITPSMYDATMRQKVADLAKAAGLGDLPQVPAGMDVETVRREPSTEILPGGKLAMGPIPPQTGFAMSKPAGGIAAFPETTPDIQRKLLQPQFGLDVAQESRLGQEAGAKLLQRSQDANFNEAVTKAAVKAGGQLDQLSFLKLVNEHGPSNEATGIMTNNLKMMIDPKTVQTAAAMGKIKKLGLEKGQNVTGWFDVIAGYPAATDDIIATWGRVAQTVKGPDVKMADLKAGIFKKYLDGQPLNEKENRVLEEMLLNDPMTDLGVRLADLEMLSLSGITDPIERAAEAGKVKERIEYIMKFIAGMRKGATTQPGGQRGKGRYTIDEIFIEKK